MAYWKQRRRRANKLRREREAAVQTCNVDVEGGVRIARLWLDNAVRRRN